MAKAAVLLSFGRHILRRAPYSLVCGEEVVFEDESLVFEVQDLGFRLQG